MNRLVCRNQLVRFFFLFFFFPTNFCDVVFWSERNFALIFFAVSHPPFCLGYEPLNQPVQPFKPVFQTLNDSCWLNLGKWGQRSLRSVVRWECSRVIETNVNKNQDTIRSTILNGWRNLNANASKSKPNQKSKWCAWFAKLLVKPTKQTKKKKSRLDWLMGLLNFWFDLVGLVG